MPALGYTFAGPHHEIYLSDPRRTDAARLKPCCGSRCAADQALMRART
jgi:hypothetical protein